MNALVTTKSDKNELSEREKLFIEALFDNEGNISAAKEIAGYAKGTSPHAFKKVQEAIIEHGRYLLALNTPKAITKMVGVLDNPMELGNDKIIETAKQILDRVGIIKKEQIEIETNMPNAILLLPPKNKEE